MTPSLTTEFTRNLPHMLGDNLFRCRISGLLEAYRLRLLLIGASITLLIVNGDSASWHPWLPAGCHGTVAVMDRFRVIPASLSDSTAHLSR
jgi:hypothetical protein